MKNHIDWVGIVKGVIHFPRINLKAENILKVIIYISWFFKPILVKTPQKPIIGLSDNPIPIIRNIGSQR